MKVLFMRHGESKAQAKLVDEATTPDSEVGLTDNGIEQVKNAAREFHDNIDAVYASPYYRTQLTAQIFLQESGINKPIITDERLHEIDYGYPRIKEELTAVAVKQVAGDYEIRFGNTGENKREIVTRLFSFLVDIFKKHKPTDTVLAVSHGRAMSVLQHEFNEINNIPDTEHGGTKNAQIKDFELTPERVANIVQRIKELNTNSK